ncbi:MAG: hypothetical protein R8P61_18740 [Bacteroidia bacterium]|nr:hypothetical protein [Bacteroidia bacterium]
MRLFIVLPVLLLLMSCEAPEEPFKEVDILAEFVGHWERLNVFDGEIDQLIILEKEGGDVSIQLWGNCLPDKCEWGSRLFKAYELEAGPLEMLWLGEGLKIKQTLTLLSSGKMEIIFEEDHEDDRLDTVKSFLFSRNNRIKLFDRIERKEALRAKLSREKIPATPNQENLLLPNSILLYQTTAGRYGKLQIRGNSSILTLRWKSWNEDGSIFREADYMETMPNAYFEMNQGKEEELDADCRLDFLLEESESGARFLNPQCGASFVLYHLGN